MSARPPDVAWATIGLAIVCVTAVAGSVAATAVGALPWPVALGISSAACFAGFTPVHEAAHGNVSRIPIVNGAVGHACALLILGSFSPYRFLHEQHHRHTNDPRHDPDHWGARGPPAWAWLRWLSQDVGYLRFYAARWRSRPVRERVDLVACGAAYGLALAVALCADRWLAPAGGARLGIAILAGWFLPARIALLGLAFAFAWLPHAPHTTTAAVDRFRATTLSSAPILNLLLLGQSYHLVHHLYPRIPFYRLAATWRLRREALIAAGGVDRHARAQRGHGAPSGGASP